MRQSAPYFSTAVWNISKDLLCQQPLQLLSGVYILGNASSGNMSKGVAASSMDKRFIQGRQKQVFGNL